MESTGKSCTSPYQDQKKKAVRLHVSKKIKKQTKMFQYYSKSREKSPVKILWTVSSHACPEFEVYLFKSLGWDYRQGGHLKIKKQS